MNRLFLYYKRVLNQKYLYYLVGKEIGVSLWSRLTHNHDLLNPKYANEVSKLIFNKDGSPRSRFSLNDTELDRLDELLTSHKTRSKFCLEYWVKNKLKEVPEEYIKQFVADRYADCGLDTSRFLTSNRDLFFCYDREGNTYSSQVRDMLVSLINNKSTYKSNFDLLDVSNNGEGGSPQ